MSENKDSSLPTSEAVKDWKPLVEPDEETLPTSEAVKDWKPLVEPGEELPPTSEVVVDKEPPEKVKSTKKPFWSGLRQMMRAEKKKE